jgi:hypothetical protein
MVADGSSKIHFMNPTGSATAPPSPPLTAASDRALGGAIAVSKSHSVWVPGVRSHLCPNSLPTHTHSPRQCPATPLLNFWTQLQCAAIRTVHTPVVTAHWSVGWRRP